MDILGIVERLGDAPGAALMGFGGMLAGGCAIGAVVTDLFIDQRPARVAA